ncbi:MAG: hypothetical protein Q7R73_05605 [bacterium]|nr:hypothetical protein [bacterium]
MKGFGSRWTAFLVLLVLTTQLSGCFTWGNNYSGKKFWSEEVSQEVPKEVSWKKFHDDIRKWLRDDRPTAKEVVDKFGTPLMTGSSKDGADSSWWYQELEFSKWSYIVGKRERSHLDIYTLTVFFDNNGSFRDFRIVRGDVPGSSKLWTTEEVVKLAIGAATIYIGGMMVQKTITDAANSAAQQGAAGFQGF